MKEIVQDGASILREVAELVPESMFGTPELKALIATMTDALDQELEGVALAAPQIGVPYRVFIVRKDRTLPPEPEGTVATIPPVPVIEVYVNPEIVKTSKKRALADEGCLSVRGVYGTTSRHERATVRARTIDGSKFERGRGGLMAQIFEHEIDHLNGILFIDHAEHLVHLHHEPVA
ncbi:MAG: peptide deformylase, peptide deformylase [Parcubacteria group bacterium]|nr:peptide deformylase, peptide deformylase [Parcubacteria group bacterium]